MGVLGPCYIRIKIGVIMKRFGAFVGRWAINILLSLDQLLNSILLGDPDETVSSRIGRIKQKWGGSVPLFRPITRITDKILDKIDPGHSLDAIEEDEGEDGLVDKPTQRGHNND